MRTEPEDVKVHLDANKDRLSDVVFSTQTDTTHYHIQRRTYPVSGGWVERPSKDRYETAAEAAKAIKDQVSMAKKFWDDEGSVSDYHASQPSNYRIVQERTIQTRHVVDGSGRGITSREFNGLDHPDEFLSRKLIPVDGPTFATGHGEMKCLWACQQYAIKVKGFSGSIGQAFDLILDEIRAKGVTHVWRVGVLEWYPLDGVELPASEREHRIFFCGAKGGRLQQVWDERFGQTQEVA